MGKGRRRTKPLGVHGLYGKNFPRGIQWRIDQDYTDQLTEEERQWLSDFNDAYYGTDYRDAPGLWKAQHKSEARANKRSAQRDLYGWTEPFFSDELDGWRQAMYQRAPASQNPLGLLDRIDARIDFVRTPDANADWDKIHADLRPTPEYLNSTEYKAAREELRSRIVKSRDRLDWEPKDTPELRESMLELEEIVSRHVEREED